MNNDKIEDAIEDADKIEDAHDNPNRVAATKVDDLWVSTVKLPFDHMFGGGPSQWYETMIFPADRATGKITSWAEKYCRRYATVEQAREGHDRAIQWAKEQQGEGVE